MDSVPAKYLSGLDSRGLDDDEREIEVHCSACGGAMKTVSVSDGSEDE